MTTLANGHGRQQILRNRIAGLGIPLLGEGINILALGEEGWLRH